MCALKDLPAGKKFTAAGLGKKLNSATRSDNLQGLKGHREAINAIAKKRQGLIRSGKYTSSLKKLTTMKFLRRVAI